MNSAFFARSNGVIPAQPSADHTGKEGYAVALTSGAATANPAVAVATISTSATIPAEAVILNGLPNDGRFSDVGIIGGIPPIRVKISGVVANGDQLAQAADGTFVTDPGAGTARVVCGIALEDGVAGDLIIAQLFAGQIRA